MSTTKTPLTDQLRNVKHSSIEPWLKARLHSLTAGDAITVTDARKWYHSTLYKLWAYKTGLMVREDVRGSQLMRMRCGLEHERMCAKLYREFTGRPTENPGQYTRIIHPACEYISFTPDRLVAEWQPVNVEELEKYGVQYTMVGGEPGDFVGPGVLEMKTTDKWAGVEWEEEVPTHHLIQLAHQLLCTEYLWGSIVVLIGGNDYRIFDVKRDSELCSMLHSACGDFWTRYVLPEVEPPLCEDDIVLYSTQNPVIDDTHIQLTEEDEDVVADWEVAKSASAAANKEADDKKAEKDRLMARIIQRMGTAQAAYLPGQEHVITHKVTDVPASTSTRKAHTRVSVTKKAVKKTKGK